MALTKGGGGKSGFDAGAETFANGETAAGGGGPSTIYMGQERTRPTARDRKFGMSPRKAARFASPKEAELDFYTWDAKKQIDFLSKGLLAGLLEFGDGPMEAGKLWKKLVKEAGFYGQTGALVSPMDILAMYVKGVGGAQAKGAWVRQGDFEVNSATGEKRYVGPQFKTTTQSRIDLTDPATARAIATKMFQDLMGRNPGRGEVGAFAAALAQAERGNPLTETTTTEFDMTTGEAIGSDSVTQGGLTADARAMIAQDQVTADPEFGAVQASTTYMNALENAVYGAPG